MTRLQVEQREKALNRNSCICPVCGGSIYQNGTPQYAHKIGNTESNRRKYGTFFVDSTYNGEYVCSLNCNATIDVGKSKGSVLDTLADILLKEMKDFTEGKEHD